jgi:hypothetical protein
MAKPFVLATLGYLVPTFILGFTWHFWIFPGAYEALGIYNRAEPIIPLGLLSMAIQALVMAYLFPFFLRDRSSVTRGVAFGLIMGAFLFSVSTLANAAKIVVANMATWLLLQASFHAVQFVIAGALIGLAYGRPTAHRQRRPLAA